MGVIFLFSSRPAIPTSDVYWQDFAIKKLAHVVVYFVLGSLMYRSLKNTTPLTGMRLVIWSIVLTGLYAASDEYHQSLVPGRGPNIRDVGIDIVGGSLAVYLQSKRGNSVSSEKSSV